MPNITAYLTDSRRLIYILGGAIALMIFITFIVALRGFGGGGGGEDAELEVWGVFDDERAFDEAIKSFEQANKGIQVTYRVFPYAEYEQALLNALAAGQGPDAFMIHHTWLPRHQDKIQPLPAEFPDTQQPLMTERQFRDIFVDVAASDLVSEGKIYGMPLYVDTLALYYNRDMLSSAGIPAPSRTWTEFLGQVEALTQLDASRNIVRSGLALGTVDNVNRGTDAVMMLMLQSGTQMTNDDNTEATFARPVDGTPVGERSLQFYTDFANPGKAVYTWNDTQDYSVDAFVSGQTAMMLNYSHQVPVIRDRAPRLNWGIAPVPQASTADVRTYANYWPMTVALQSEYPYEAWKFVNHMAAGMGTVPYLNETGRPAARRDLIAQQKNDPDLGVFAEQALSARSWYQIDNVAIEQVFTDMVNAVNLGRQTVAQALREAESRVTVLMSR